MNEKRVFQRLLTANGVGPSLALGLLSTLSADRLVRAIREKLAGLAFLDPTVSPLVDTIDTVLGQLPSKGKITGLQLEALRGVLSLMTDVSKMRQHSQLILNGDPNGLVFAVDGGDGSSMFGLNEK